MNVTRVFVVTVLTALLTSVGVARDAQAASLPACVADDIIAADLGCPATGPCTITEVFSVLDGCVFDFGTRDVTVSVSGELQVLTGSATLRAGTFTVGPGGLVEGNTTTIGGSFTVETTGDIVVQRADRTGRIRMSGEEQGGSLLLDAGGDIRIEGQLHAHNRTVGTAAGGDIVLRAAGDILIASGSEVDPHGGQLAFGGYLDLVAGGLIDIGSSIDGTGGDGGEITMSAGGKVIIRDKLNTTGEGDAGSGGDIDISAGTDVVIAGQVLSRGTGSGTGSGGGDGGTVFISASFGNITVSDEVSVRSGAPDGVGGDIELLAQGWIDVQPTGLLIADGNGFESDGGDVLLDAETDITINGLIEAEGGDSGGDIDIDAGRDIAIHELVSARSTNQGSFGGSVTIQAGVLTSGNFALTDTIDASGPGCDAFGSCSLGGDADVSACDLRVESQGLITVTAPGLEGNGGTIFLTARDQMTIQGSLDATGAGEFLDGSNTLVYPSGVPPILSGSVLPAPITMPRATCTGSPGDQPFCLDPCPVCGNGVAEFPETCDDTTGTAVSCDGCSAFCRLEDCDDRTDCTDDLCDEFLGCLNVAVADGNPCSDGNVCTDNECDGFGRCAAVPNDDPCDDGLFCNGGDTCRAGSCSVHAGDPCSPAGTTCNEDDDTCETVGRCTPLTGDTTLDCAVDIVELQSCIAMFLDLIPADACADPDASGGVGIVELQSCIGSFLGLLSCPSAGTIA